MIDSIDVTKPYVTVIRTRQTHPNLSNMSRNMRKFGDMAENRGHAVYIKDALGKYWRWRRWKHPFADSDILFEARLDAGER